jgi:DUF971 family protein
LHSLARRRTKQKDIEVERTILRVSCPSAVTVSTGKRDVIVSSRVDKSPDVKPSGAV